MSMQITMEAMSNNAPPDNRANARYPLGDRLQPQHRLPPSIGRSGERTRGIRVRMCEQGSGQAGDHGVGAVSPSAVPAFAFHSLAHSAPQRLAQLARTALSSSFLCVSASSGLTATRVVIASLPMVHGCLPVLQLSASPVVVLTVVHILSS